jgi:hypothetical protein
MAPIKQYSIYDHPDDYPDGFVVREWLVTAGDVQAGTASTAASLEEARKLIPAGAERTDRAPSDDPKIVETWILPPAA